MKSYLDLEIPKFNRKYVSVLGYFTKLKSFLSNYEINDKETISNYLIFGLEGESLELYCALDEKYRTDLDYLEGIFLDHFEGRKHEFIETKELFAMRKGLEQSISKFRLRVCIKAYRIKASERMKLFAFKNGIPHSYLVHVAKMKAKSFEEVVLECENFEKIQELEVYLNKQEETRVHEQAKGANRVNADTR